MTGTKEKRKMKDIISKIRFFIAIAAIISISSIVYSNTDPSAPDFLENTTLAQPASATGQMLNISGGTISNITLNATTQNPRWKGFVGNINGELALRDSTSSSLFDWDLTSVTGEIYATRNSTVPDWDSVVCASDAVIQDEQTALNITASNVDSIENTFSTKSHDEFYCGISQITSDSCYSVYLNVNSTEQSASFQEVLLADSNTLIYAGLIENSTYGFNNETYDFQLIVAENALEGSQPNTAYYFYVELI